MPFEFAEMILVFVFCLCGYVSACVSACLLSQPNSLIVHWRNALNYIRWDRTGKHRTSNSSRRIASASRLHYALRAWHSYRHMDVRASRVKAQLLKLLRFWSAFNPFLMQIAPRTRCCGCLLNSTLTSHLAKSHGRVFVKFTFASQVRPFVGEWVGTPPDGHERWEAGHLL